MSDEIVQPSESIESIESSETQTQEQPKEVTPEVKKRLKSLQLKIDGIESTEDLPFEIDDDPKIVEWMTKNLQMSKMAGKRATEKATFEREVSSFIQELKTNPRKALSNPAIGLDVKKFAQEIIEEEIAQMQKSPEQIEKESITKELQELKAEREREREEFRQKELKRGEQEEFQRYDSIFTKALESVELPKTPYTTKKMADTMLAALEHGIQVEPQDIVGIVKEEIMKDIEDMFSAMPSEVVSKIIGKKHLDGLRKTNLAKVKEQTIVNNAKNVSEVSKAAPKAPEAKKMTYSEFFKL
jgi:hypothetical protein